MSTRSIIIVTGNDNYGRNCTIRLYKHSDGYPTGNLPLIYEAITNAKCQCNEHNRKFKSGDPKMPSTEQMTGLLIGASTDVYGIGADIDEDEPRGKAVFSEAFKSKHLGNQSDLEWLYVIDLCKQTIKIYGGGYSGNSPQHVYRKGTVDPRTYAKELQEEYQADELAEINKAIRLIESTGYTLNPKPKRKRVKIESAATPTYNIIPLKAAA